MRSSNEIIKDISSLYESKRNFKNIVVFCATKDVFYTEELCIDKVQKKYSKVCYDANYVFSPASISMKENNLINELFKALKKEENTKKMLTNK